MKALLTSLVVAFGLLPGAYGDLLPEPTPIKAYTKPSDIGLPQNYPKSRETVNVHQLPWRAIGQVNVGRQQCSGVLISERLVLTVAHCLWSSINHSWVAAEYIHFVAAYDRGDYLAHSKVKSYRKDPDNLNGLNIHLGNTHLDWAVLELEKPVGATLGFLPLMSAQQLKKGQLLSLAGYRSDRPEVMTVQRDCKLLKSPKRSGILTHNCSVIGGDSGGPLLVQRNNIWRVLGVQSLEVSQGGTVWGQAAALEPSQLPN